MRITKLRRFSTKTPCREHAGRWTFFNLDGEKIAEGEFRDGSLGVDQRPYDDDVFGREGRWMLEPGDLGVRDGEWECLVTDYRPDGGIPGRTNYRKGEHHGRRELWHPNGRKWVDAIYDGGVRMKGRAWDENGRPEPLD